MTAMEPTATRIPTAPDFPVTWEQPGDEHHLWTRDRMHFPGVIPPLDDSLLRILYLKGMAQAAEQFKLPVRLVPRRINGYHYLTFAPLPLPHEELAELERQSGALMEQQIPRLRQDWEGAILPEIQRLVAEAEAIDYRARSLAELAGDLDDAIARTERAWTLHFMLAFRMNAAPSVFEEFYREVFSEADPLAALRLLQGLDNLTVQMGQELWQLSRVARQSPEVMRVIEEVDPASAMDALRQSEAGRAFAARLESWLTTYGHRGDRLGISSSSWIEDPAPVFRMLKEYLGREGFDPAVEQARLAQAREAAIAEARERLASYPEAVRGQFEGMLRAAQEAVVISEDHGYWIDFRATYQLRRVAAAIGEKLAESGRLNQAEDIQYLTLDELGEAARQPDVRDLKALVAEREAETAHFATLTPPPALGSMPPGPPPDNPMTRSLTKFFGAPPPKSDDPSLLRGVGASRGTVSGTVKVVRSLDEAGKLRPGDILVTETTTPTWTPLFNTAAAVVADSGGILSHCAVVAREYGIPAVVGTGGGTELLRDGQTVEVDGTAGTVRIVAD